MGFKITARLQPFILPYSEQVAERFVKTLADCGVWAFQTEGLKLRVCMSDKEKAVYSRIGKVLGFDILSNFKDIFVFESCAEQKFSTNLVTQIGCASYADLTILGVDISEYGQPENKQRGDCMCLAKKQILNVKPARCKHQCLYCFWK